jgi:predicted nucleic acid-binding protein
VGSSLNQTVIDLLRQSLGVTGIRGNGVGRGVSLRDAGLRRNRPGTVEVSRYCLDTVAYSQFKRREGRITRMLDRAEWIGVPLIGIGELCVGFAKGSRVEKNIEELDEFLALPVVETLPVDREIAELFGEMIESLRRRGRPLPVNAVWIAATCARAGATLLTWDAHFRWIPRVGTLVLDSDATS